jgi:hypothetical protein
MIRTLSSSTILLLTGVAFAANPSADLSVNVTPTPPAAAAAAGFTTLALDSEFSQPQPTGWLGCRGSASGAKWYAGIEGGDTVTVPCSTTGGSTRFNLVIDQTTGKQVLDLTFLESDLASGAHYTTIQSVDDSASPCCTMGELFPYGFYMETKYRIVNTPSVPLGGTGGVWWAFWQGGQGLSPFTNPHGTNVEIDHPEQHGELFASSPSQAGPMFDWAVINWNDGSGSKFIPPSGFDYQNNFDVTAYHTYGVRVTTDGSSGLATCSYIDSTLRNCVTSVFNNAAQYAERKYMILFAGIACYDPGFGSLTAGCVNVPINSIYQCNGTFVCIHFSSALPENFNPVLNVSGVTGATGINGSWQTQAWSGWSNGATDWILLWPTGDVRHTPSNFNGTPTGGTINPVSQVDLFIDSVRVWGCANWATQTCTTALLTGAP